MQPVVGALGLCTSSLSTWGTGMLAERWQLGCGHMRNVRVRRSGVSKQVEEAVEFGMAMCCRAMVGSSAAKGAQRCGCGMEAWNARFCVRFAHAGRATTEV